MKRYFKDFMKNGFADNRGFTLIEMITAMAIMALLTCALYSLFLTGGKIYQTSHDSYKAQNEARIAMSYITVKIRQNDAVTSSGETYTQNVNVEPGNVLNIKTHAGTNYLIYLQGDKLVEETTGAAFGISEIAEGFEEINFTTSSPITDSTSIGIKIKYNDGVNTKELKETVTLRANP